MTNRKTLTAAWMFLVLVGFSSATVFGYPPRIAGAGKAKGRVPANYAKIDLSEEQKTKIYEVQDKYKEQIAALQAQLKELQAKQTKEVEDVLTAEQKAKLQELAAAAKAARAAAPKGKAAKAKAEDKPAEPKKAEVKN